MPPTIAAIDDDFFGAGFDPPVAGDGCAPVGIAPTGCAPVPTAIPAVECSCVGISSTVGIRNRPEGVTTGTCDVPVAIGDAVVPVGVRCAKGVCCASAPDRRPGGVSIMPVSAVESTCVMTG